MKPKSPAETVGGMPYFPRMLDKIRLHATGTLEADYLENLGKGSDGRCAGFLRVSYDQLRERVLRGGTDEEILEWCFATGRRLDRNDVRIWAGYIMKLGWNDAASQFLADKKAEYGLADREDIQTIPQLIDLDEGRL